MKLVVAHTGARRGYAVPSILEDAGMLERFYTDICADVGLGKALLSLRRLGLRTPELDRLATRRLPPNIINKTVTFTVPNLKYYWSRRQGRRDEKAFLANVRWQHALGRCMARTGFGDATWLHSFLDEFSPLIVAAKQRGLKVVSEIYILLSADRLLREERRHFPGWEEDVPDYDEISSAVYGRRVLFTHSDFILCPSESVREDAVGNFGFPAECAVVVPYGVGNEWFSLHSDPVPGRVLFVGTADLRKGIHYLGMAAEKLHARGLRYEFRIAGDVTPQVMAHRTCRYLNFLGRIPRDRIAEEFTRSDLLVLPSLAEGSAGVTYEALAAGIPVIATKEAGSVVRDEMEGRIVPCRDPQSLAEAIAEIVEHRKNRNRMAMSARERAKDFTWECYGKRLVEALRSFE